MVAVDSKFTALVLTLLMAAVFSYAILHSARINSAAVYLLLAEKNSKVTTFYDNGPEIKRYTNLAARLDSENPETHLQLAMLAIKDKNLNRDEEWQSALRLAYEPGPWEPQVQNKITKSGSRDWLSLTPELRDIVISTANRALSHPSAWRALEVRETINSRKLRVIICEEPATSGQLWLFCDL